MRRPMRRHRLAVALAGITIVLVVPSAAAGSGSPTDPGQGLAGESSEAPDDFEVTDLAERRGISAAEAEERLSWQAALPDLVAEADRTLGEAFGGVWVDPADGDRVKLAVVNGRDRAPRLSARQAAEASGLGPVTDVVPVAHSLGELRAESDWLGDRVAAVLSRSAAPLASGMRPDLNAVVLHLPEGGQLSAEMVDLVSEARRRLGDMLHVEHDARPARALVCSYPFCNPPLRGGVAIRNSANEFVCTAAFLARSRTTGALYQFTAGHCHVMARSGTWYTRFVDGTPHDIGPVHNAVWSLDGDMAILRVDNPEGWRARAWVFVTDGPDTARNETYNIARDGTSESGLGVCVTGARWGRSMCGNVQELNQTVEYCDATGTICRIVRHLARSTLCGVAGDSGAPVFNRHTAYGLLVAGDGSCNTYYQGISGAEDALNVSVSHEG